MNLIKPFALSATTLLLCAAVSVAAPAKSAKTKMSAKPMTGLSQLDKDFLKGVNEANNAERSYVPVVMKNASSAAVKSFGQTMIHDHTAANQALVKLASSKGVKLPHDVPAHEKAVIKRLSREKGAQFDAAYRHEMIRDHTADVGVFKREISLGRDPAVKAYAAKYLPTIEQHLKMAQNLPTLKMAGTMMHKTTASNSKMSASSSAMKNSSAMKSSSAMASKPK